MYEIIAMQSQIKRAMETISNEIATKFSWIVTYVGVKNFIKCRDMSWDIVEELSSLKGKYLSRAFSR